MTETRYRIPAISPGAILREEMQAGTEFGKQAAELTDHGQLVPDDLVLKLIAGWLEKRDGAFVCDGFPRTLGQAKAFTQMLAKHDKNENHANSKESLEAVLALEVGEETLRKRITFRRVCEKCGHTQSVEKNSTNDANSEVHCPVCGGILTKRKDDTPEVFASRMQEYREKTEPLLAYYEAEGILHRVNADRTPEIVFSEIAEILES